jgi:hypothetical protein
MTRLCAYLFLIFLLIPAASAASVTITPTGIDPGDTITVNIQDLPNGAAFSFSILGEFDVTPGERFTFTARDLTLPFSLGSGEVSAYTRGTDWTGLTMQSEDFTVTLGGSAENGEFRKTQAYNISSGTYEAVSLEGWAAPSADSIIAEVTMQGTKTGPDDGTISFAIDGITYGTATVSVDVDGQRALSRTITIGSPPSDNGAPSPGGPAGAPPITEPPATPAATVTSPDGKVSLAGPGTEGAALALFTAQGTAPAGWSLSGSAYTLTAAGRTFDPAATLSFALPSADVTATLARYEDGAWTPVPSRIEGDRITTTVTLPGSYALLIAAPAAGTTATVTTSIPAGTTTTTTTAPAATTPAASPIAPLLPVIAFGILMFGWKRRG